ncbi:branched-chain amino acid transport system ATP-binding protein [Lutimaribacter pacificus]|uniref:Amino acid/amide ABC transporter ATP-binding protein 1, HAAT family n=1 Tax=Lutimaribacter pacificus TaxID=391948 RepID=A0A1H0IU79_9RHOB|nr:ATP-binding cassette domain-containing protein [Lutimaribacter pacificus]SDO34932.1 branched-chain amino acid transport system ATP-binding protein [Lutimaribacter pacificus]SHK17543.1 amino acid/amide ABC transporter ATP-binding protein 1, HAAT family [Lutimaribacter pacificus]
MLEVSDLRKSFGRLTVVDGVSTTVAGGECLGVMGPNGAGKSTLFDLLAGATPVDGGTIRLDGRDVTGLPPEIRVQAGIARAFQIPKPFPTLSVREHLVLAASAGQGLRGAALAGQVDEALERTGLGDKAGRTGRELRLLDRKRLELAKALASGPRVLLLDEISGGLTEHEVHALVDLIRGLKSPGLAILWIEHIAHALKAASDRILMLHLGRKVIEDIPDTVTRDPRVRELYLGQAHHA